MVPLAFCDLSQLVDEIECLSEVTEPVLFCQVVFVYNPPTSTKPFRKASQCDTSQRWNSALTGHTTLVCQFTLHNITFSSPQNNALGGMSAPFSLILTFIFAETVRVDSGETAFPF